MTATHYAELDVWRYAMDLAEAIYRLTRIFPSEERFGLASQLQRAAVSVPSNIAEGNARDSIRDYARFISIARGSMAEIETQLLLAARIGIGDTAAIDDCRAQAQRISRMLQGLHKALKKKFHSDSCVSNPQSPVPSPQL